MFILLYNSKVDSNADYDSLDIVGHDAEEKYFDADEGSNEGYSFSASSPEREKWMSSSMEEEEEDKSKPESIEESKVWWLSLRRYVMFYEVYLDNYVQAWQMCKMLIRWNV